MLRFSLARDLVLTESTDGRRKAQGPAEESSPGVGTRADSFRPRSSIGGTDGRSMIVKGFGLAMRSLHGGKGLVEEKRSMIW